MMSELVHGHEIIKFISEAGGTFDKLDLKHSIESKFGADTKYYTCSEKDLSASELIDFLEAKGKFTLIENKITTDKSKMCSH